MRSVQRILAVFECFTSERNSLTLQEIADRIDLPKSTAFRIVRSLEKAGYLVRLEDQQYCLSLRFTRLSGLVRSTLGVREIARPIAAELAERTREAVSLHMISDGKRVCIDAIATAAPLRSVTQPGEEAPLVAGSSSKMLVAHLPDRERAPIVAQIARTTGRTKADVRAELAKIRDQGYAVSHGERVLGVSAISAPIKEANEEVRHCLSVAGPTIRMQSNEKELVALVVKAAADISRRCGGKLDGDAVIAAPEGTRRGSGLRRSAYRRNHAPL